MLDRDLFSELYLEEFFEDILEVELTEDDIEKIWDYGLVELIDDMNQEGIINGILQFKDVDEVENYFYDEFQEIYGVDDDVMFFVDLNRYIYSLEKGGEVSLYKVGEDEPVYVVLYMNQEYDPDEIKEFIDKI